MWITVIYNVLICCNIYLLVPGQCPIEALQVLGILSNASTGKPLIMCTLPFVNVVNQIFAKNVMHSSYF